jgi:hypothetical protein
MVQERGTSSVYPNTVYYCCSREDLIHFRAKKECGA